jgi:O-antigen ligase
MIYFNYKFRKKSDLFNKKLFIYIYLPSLLLISLPFLLITGSLLSDLAVSLSAIIFVINSLKNNLIKYYKNVYFYFFIVFYLILILSSLLSNYPHKSLLTSLFYLRFGIFALSTWYLISINPKIIHYIFYSLSLAFSILLIDGYFQFFNGTNLFGLPIHGTRVSSLFGSELILGSYLSRLLPILLASLIFILKNKKNNYLLFFSIIVFILTDVLIFLSGERASFFFVNLSALILIIFLNSYKKFRIISFITSILLILIISNFYPKFKERIFDKTLDQISLNKKEFNFSFETTADSSYLFTIEHDFLFKSAFAMFLDNKILGVGPKLFRVECHNPKYFKAIFSCNTHPHNTYIQLLSETGIAGFSMIFFGFIFLIYYCFKHLYLKFFYKKNTLSDFQISLISAVFITLWPIVPTGNFFNNWINIVYYLPLGMLLWSFNKKIFGR